VCRACTLYWKVVSFHDFQLIQTGSAEILVQYPCLPFCVLFYIQLILLWTPPTCLQPQWQPFTWRCMIHCQVTIMQCKIHRRVAIPRFMIHCQVAILRCMIHQGILSLFVSAWYGVWYTAELTFQGPWYATKSPFYRVSYTAELAFGRISPRIFSKIQNHPRVPLMGLKEALRNIITLSL